MSARRKVNEKEAMSLKSISIPMYVSEPSHRSFRNKCRYKIYDDIYDDPELVYLLTKIKNEKK